MFLPEFFAFFTALITSIGVNTFWCVLAASLLTIAKITSPDFKPLFSAKLPLSTFNIITPLTSFGILNWARIAEVILFNCKPRLSILFLLFLITWALSIFSKDSNSPRITLKDLLLLDLQTTTWTFFPIFVDATKRGRSLDLLISSWRKSSGKTKFGRFGGS